MRRSGGTLVGRGIRRWAGVPYATAARWQPPVPVPWDDDAPHDAFGPSAPQRHRGFLVEAVPGMRVGQIDEDCLTLNVWAPDGAGPGDGLPVLVWVHGGAYVIGGSSLPTYDGTALAAEAGAVVVSINYRLGALGFLCRPGATANLGSRDQVAALRWVREHIAGFGGDPDLVTAFGESAGAGSLLHLLGAPEADGLFRRVILQSPGAEVVHRPLAEDLGAAFVARAGGLDGVPPGAVLDAQEAAAADLASRFGSMPWCPVVDGDLIPEDPRRRIAAGGCRGVDVLLGTTASELSLFSGALRDAPRDAVAKVARHLLTPALGHDPGEEACAALVESYAREVPGDTATEVLSDAAMGVPAVLLSDDLARHNPATWAYRFDWPAPGLGAFHAVDLPFTFGTFDVDGWAEFVGADDAAQALSTRVMRAWGDFARTGDPGWAPYSPTARRTMVLGRTDHETEHPLAERLHLHDYREDITT